MIVLASSSCSVVFLHRSQVELSLFICPFSFSLEIVAPSISFSSSSLHNTIISYSPIFFFYCGFFYRVIARLWLPVFASFLHSLKRRVGTPSSEWVLNQMKGGISLQKERRAKDLFISILRWRARCSIIDREIRVPVLSREMIQQLVVGATAFPSSSSSYHLCTSIQI